MCEWIRRRAMPWTMHDGSLQSHYCPVLSVHTKWRRPIIARRHTTVTVMPWTTDDGPLKSNYCPVVWPFLGIDKLSSRWGRLNVKCETTTFWSWDQQQDSACSWHLHAETETRRWHFGFEKKIETSSKRAPELVTLHFPLPSGINTRCPSASYCIKRHIQF